MRTAFKYLPERAETETRVGEPVKGSPLTLPPPCGGQECRQQNLWAIKKTTPGGVFLCAPRRSPSPAQKEYPIRQDGVFFLEMCCSAGEIAALTCAKRVKSGGETGHRRSPRERNAAAGQLPAYGAVYFRCAGALRVRIRVKSVLRQQKTLETKWFQGFPMVRGTGLEPVTPCTSSMCSTS